MMGRGLREGFGGLFGVANILRFSSGLCPSYQQPLFWGEAGGSLSSLCPFLTRMSAAMSCGPSQGAWEVWSVFGISMFAGTRSPSCLKVSSLASRRLRVESAEHLGHLGRWLPPEPFRLPLCLCRVG